VTPQSTAIPKYLCSTAVFRYRVGWFKIAKKPTKPIFQKLKKSSKYKSLNLTVIKPPLNTHITANNFKALGIKERLSNIHTKLQPAIGTFNPALVQNITVLACTCEGRIQMT
jgi:hypothetical protein